MQKSYEYYQELLAGFPQFTNDTKINFAVGKILLLLRDANGLMYFSHLQTLKGSKKVKTSASMWSAIYLFENKKYAQAQKILNKIKAGKLKALEHYLSYQGAWLDFIINKESPSKITTVLQIQLNSLDAANNTKKNTKMRKENEILKDYILNDLAYFAAYQLNDAIVKNVFERYRRLDLHLAVLEYEIKTLVDAAKYSRGLALIKKLSLEFPSYQQLYLLYELERDVYFAQKNYGQMLSSIWNMGIFFDEQSIWYRGNIKRFRGNFVRDVQANLRIGIMNLAGLVKKNQTDKNMANRISIQLYEFLRKYDRGSSSSWKFMIEFAGFLQAANRLSDSTEVLLQVVKNKSFNSEDRKKISYTMIAQAKTIYSVFLRQKETEKNHSKMPKELQIYNDAVEAFVPLHPSDKMCPSLLLSVAKNRLQFGDKAGALVVFRNIVDRYSPSGEADASMNVIIDIYKADSMWMLVESNSKKFLSVNKFYAKNNLDRIFEVLKISQLKLAEEDLKKGQSEAAAKKFEKFGDNYPSDYRTPGAMVSAFYLRMKLLLSHDISRVALKYLKNYPQDKNRPNVVLSYAEVLMKTGDIRQSALWFTQFAKENPRHKEAIKYMKQGFSFFRAVDEVDYALKAIDEFALLSASAANDKDLLLQKAEIYEEIGQYPQAIKVYEKLSKPKPMFNDISALAAVKIQVLLMRLSKHSQNLNKAHDLKKLLLPLPYQRYFEAKNELAKLYLGIGLATKEKMRYVEKEDPANFISYSESLEKQVNVVDSALKKALDIGAKKIDEETFFHLASVHREISKRYQGLLNKNDFMDFGSYQRANARREKMHLEHQTKANKYIDDGIAAARSANIFDGMYYKLVREKEKINAGSNGHIEEVHFWPGYLSLSTSSTFTE